MIDRSIFNYDKQPNGICVLFSFAKAIDVLTDHSYDYNLVISKFWECIKLNATSDVSHTYIYTYLFPYLQQHGLSGILCEKHQQPNFEELRNRANKFVLCLSFSHGQNKDWHVVNVAYDLCNKTNTESYYVVDPNADHPVGFDCIMNDYKINHFGDCLLLSSK